MVVRALGEYHTLCYIHSSIYVYNAKDFFSTNKTSRTVHPRSLLCSKGFHQTQNLQRKKNTCNNKKHLNPVLWFIVIFYNIIGSDAINRVLNFIGLDCITSWVVTLHTHDRGNTLMLVEETPLCWCYGELGPSFLFIPR